MSMYSNLSKSDVDVIAAKFLRVWTRSKRKKVSLDADTYAALFPYLERLGVIKEKGKDKVLFVIVDREKAIEQVKEYRNLQDARSGSRLR